MNDEGLTDASAANPFRLPRLHPGIGLSASVHFTASPDNEIAYENYANSLVGQCLSPTAGTVRATLITRTHDSWLRSRLTGLMDFDTISGRWLRALLTS